MLFIFLSKLETHIFVPKHEVLSPKEAKKVLERYGVTQEELPKIKKTDPAIEKFDAKIGDMIKITRESSIIDNAIYYRVVIPD